MIAMCREARYTRKNVIVNFFAPFAPFGRTRIAESHEVFDNNTYS